MDSPLTARLFWRSLLLIALLGLGLRMLPLAESLWLDELHTSWVISGDWEGLAKRARQGNNSPLYFWGMKLVVACFGDDEWTLRMPSVICGCAALCGIGVLVRRWSGSGLAGCVAALLVALDRDMIFYATEARPYAAAQLGCIGVFAVTMRLWRDFDWRDVWIWTALAALTIHLHITAGLFVAACLPPLTLAAWGHGAWKRLALMLITLMVLLAPLSLQLQVIYARRPNWSIFIHSGTPLQIIEILPIIPFGLVPLAIALAANALLKDREASERRSAWTAIYIWAIVATLTPIGIAWIGTYLEFTPLFLRRYLIGSQALLFVWAGLNIGRIDRLWVRAIGAVAMSASIFFFHLPDHWTHQRRQDWRGAVAMLDKMELPANTTLMISSRLIEAKDLTANDDGLADYCRLPVTAIYRPEREFRQVIPLRYGASGDLMPWQLKLIAEPQTIVVLEPGGRDTVQVTAAELSKSIPWASTLRILDGNRGLQMILVEPAKDQRDK
ncbi:glycosyltransferase family 39 protein [Blastopirellula sp. JC732]|uniref:Glycosyltransferase family 39 protein n=1 Tax=Blastopirellula sediminis TaxID=2894196 RepID=A0A9X1SIN6_9BACT|nr:glycosyltransferase family 39 protein [Blastopirellula sediminis]MCC9604888.1 glycosyltransferase family 39 protein [Blastopirellula sediminis]MCC9631813.1 glycosyltransferase family 39 protein [Blastopirellula sediminis]